MLISYSITSQQEVWVQASALQNYCLGTKNYVVCQKSIAQLFGQRQNSYRVEYKLQYHGYSFPYPPTEGYDIRSF